MSNEITAYFKGTAGVSESVYQYDYGMILIIDGPDLTAPFEVHFEHTGGVDAVTAIGQDNRVAIPNACLALPGRVTAYIYDHTGQHDGQTAYVVRFQVMNRARPVDEVTDEQDSAISKAIALLAEPIDNIETIVNESLAFTGPAINSLDARINNLARLRDGSTTGDAELIDARVIGGKTYTNLHQAIDTEISGLNENVDYFEMSSMDVFSKLGGAACYARVLDGTISNPMNDHFVHTDYVPVKAGYTAQIINTRPNSGQNAYYKYAWQIFDKNLTYIGGRDLDTGTREGIIRIPANGAYIKYDIAEYNDNNYVTLRASLFQSQDVGVKVFGDNNLFSSVESCEQNAVLSWADYGINGSNFGWEVKRINAVDGSVVDSTNRLKSKNPIPKYINKISFQGYECGIFAYLKNGSFVGWWNGSTWKINNLDWISNSVVVPKGQNEDNYDMYIVLRKPNNEDLTESNAVDFQFFNKNNATEERMSYLENNIIGQNYAIGTEFTKKNLTLSKLGVLTYHQAFLKYNEKYYSIDGDHIAVQNDNFELIDSTDLVTGHGNAFCLGSNNKGYISGWDDNCVYVINLDSLIIERVIDLPTQGYTTCAVDDVKGYIYIFQRNDIPSTKARYNFIVYDYMNDEIISTVTTSVAYAAMQSVDIFRDRIIVLYGTGIPEKPNAYIIYNTNGEILGEYIIGTLSNLEPEGVFIDRNTQDVLVSYIDKKVYLIR